MKIGSIKCPFIDGESLLSVMNSKERITSRHPLIVQTLDQFLQVFQTGLELNIQVPGDHGSH